MLLISASNAHARLYKCEEGGRIVYKDTPCASGGSTLELNNPVTEYDNDGARFLKNHGSSLDGINNLCTAENLKDGFQRLLHEPEEIRLICGVPAGVTKQRALQFHPGGEILDQSPQAGMKFIQWFTDRGYKYRLEWLEKEDVIQNATLFRRSKAGTKNVKKGAEAESHATQDGGAPLTAIKRSCANSWPADYRQQEYCIGKERDAALRLSKNLNKYQEGSEQRNIVLRCMNQWKNGQDEYSYDYRQVDYCIGKEIEAYERLKLR